MQKKEVLAVLLDVTDIPAESCTLATLGINNGGAALCHPLDAINPVFVVSVIESLDELQLACPNVREIIADGRSMLPTVQPFNKAVAEI